MNNKGIWLDKRAAYIINPDQQPNIIMVNSQNEEFHVHGGSGSRLKGGPQDVVQDSKYLSREKLQLKEYVTDILKKVKKAEQIVLFGPAETAMKFAKFLSKKHPSIAQKVVATIKAKQMTQNQMVAWVKGFYFTK